MSATGSIQSPAQTAAVLGGGPFVHLDGALHASYRTSDFASAGSPSGSARTTSEA